jgi:hypothetical protein
MARVSFPPFDRRAFWEIRHGLTVHLTGQRSKWLASSYYGPNEPIKLAAEPLQQPLQISPGPGPPDWRNDRLPPAPAPQWRSAYGAGSYELSMPSGMTRETLFRGGDDLQ